MASDAGSIPAASTILRIPKNAMFKAFFIFNIVNSPRESNFLSRFHRKYLSALKSRIKRIESAKEPFH